MKDNQIKIDLDGRKITVDKDVYITAKTKDLREFGYEKLSESEVEEQLNRVLNGEELNVIGMFIEKDIVK